MTNTQKTQMEEVTSAVDYLAGEIETLNHRMKSDLTQWNLVEAIENLSFELKRLNDREEQKGK